MKNPNRTVIKVYRALPTDSEMHGKEYLFLKSTEIYNFLMCRLLNDQTHKWRQNTKDHETKDIPENSSQNKKNIK